MHRELPLLPDNALERIDKSAFKLLELMALAVEERGEPMAYEDIQDRLAEVGVVKDIVQLKRAWHGLPPLRKTLDGRLQLDTVSGKGRSRWEFLVYDVLEHLESKPVVKKEEVRADPIDVQSPFTEDELRDLMEYGGRGALTDSRWAALVIDARGPMTMEQLEEELKDLWRCRTIRHLTKSLGHYTSPLTTMPDETIVLQEDHPTIQKARGEAGKKLAPLYRRRAEARTHWVNFEEARERRSREDELTREWYATAKKVVLRCFFYRKQFAGAVVLDPDTREFVNCGSVEEVRDQLEHASIIIGLQVWKAVEQLGFEPGERSLVDLTPPVKTRTIGHGRKLKVTPSDIIEMTLNISKPLATNKELAEHHRKGHRGRLFQRMQADLKALWAFYAYGALHGYARLVWGFVDERYGVDWNVGCQPSIYDVLQDAAEHGHQLEVVVGGAPGWKDPWSRAQSAVAEGWMFSYHVVIQDRGKQVVVSPEDVHAVRVLSEGKLAPIFKLR